MKTLDDFLAEHGSHEAPVQQDKALSGAFSDFFSETDTIANMDESEDEALFGDEAVFDEDGKPSASSAAKSDAKLRERCKNRALYLLTESEKPEKKLREKLAKSGKYSQEIIDDTIEFLKRYDYIDDYRYAEHFIRLYIGNKSRREIEQKLYQRGINRKDYQRAMDDYLATEMEERQEGEMDPELTAVMKLLHKKCKDPTDLTPEDKKKLYASLMRKCFSYSIVSKALQIQADE